MYNEIKTNMLDADCDCEYVISEAGRAFTPLVYIRMYLGDIDFSAVEIRAVYSGGEEWVLPEVLGVEDLKSGWYMTRLAYSDFEKTGGYEIEVRAYYNGEFYGVKVLYFYHSNLQSSGEWNVCKNHGVNNSYNVQQISAASSGGSGGGGGGGEPSVTYTAGKGIEISDDNEISAKVDGTTVKFDGNGNLSTDAVVIENAVMMKEADAKYLLHKYTEVEYIAGNRIGYAGASNQIITQGYTAYNLGNVTTGGTNIIPSQYQYFTDLVFEKPIFLAYSSSYTYSISRIYLRFKQATTTYNRYEVVYVTTDGTELIASNIDAYFNYVESTARIMLTWTAIYPPGYTTKYNQVCEFGCAHCTPVIVHSKNSATEHYQVTTLGNNNYLPYVQFVSEAEYNAAVGLTYEPLTLTEVQETTTEV